MAIFADYTKTTYTISETETVQEEVTYPSNLLQEDPNYSKRGQTILETFPLVTESSTTTENAYIVISNYNFYKFEEENGEYLFDIIFYVYENKEAYLNDKQNYIFIDDSIGELRSIESSNDLRIKGYEILKNLPQVSNSIDD